MNGVMTAEAPNYSYLTHQTNFINARSLAENLGDLGVVPI